MIRDAKGRKWMMRFKQYQQGWHWDARHGGQGLESGLDFFATKALAEADARRYLQSSDHVAIGQEYMRRVLMRGTPCQLTAEDHEAISAAGSH
jgi:hypothetical protein